MILYRTVSAISNNISVNQIRVSFQRRKQPWYSGIEQLVSATDRQNGFHGSRYQQYEWVWQYSREYHTCFHRKNRQTSIHDCDEERDRSKSRNVASIQQRQRTFPLSPAFYHTSRHNDKAVAIFLSLGAISAGAYAAASAVRAWNEYKASTPVEEQKSTVNDENKTSSNTHQSVDASVEEENDHQKQQQQQQQQNSAKASENAGKRENIFKQWFGIDVGTKYYEGGFEDKMTRREAALILGVRETSTTRRIKEAHRKLLVLNHPDTGGSTYLSGKINEAKELLLKGRQT
jgi:hypothetical protein